MKKEGQNEKDGRGRAEEGRSQWRGVVDLYMTPITKERGSAETEHASCEQWGYLCTRTMYIPYENAFDLEESHDSVTYEEKPHSAKR